LGGTTHRLNHTTQTMQDRKKTLCMTERRLYVHMCSIGGRIVSS
jgi:hypothetical protein